MPSFREWKLPALEKRFALKRVKNSTLLNDWLDGSYTISNFEELVVTRLRETLDNSVFHWNEIELAMNFIGPLLWLVNFATEDSNLFDERELRGNVEGEEMYGLPDGMIATGFREPEKPYFCLTEFKKETDPNGDPIGQCLSAMLTAQAVNQDGKPIYGIYIIGQNWSFIVLKGKEYAVSGAYSAITSEIFDIFRRLCYLKGIIQENVNQNKLLKEQFNQ